jgi:hypothetical protein
VASVDPSSTADLEVRVRLGVERGHGLPDRGGGRGRAADRQAGHGEAGRNGGTAEWRRDPSKDGGSTGPPKPLARSARRSAPSLIERHPKREPQRAEVSDSAGRTAVNHYRPSNREHEPGVSPGASHPTPPPSITSRVRMQEPRAWSVRSPRGPLLYGHPP